MPFVKRTKTSEGVMCMKKTLLVGLLTVSALTLGACDAGFETGQTVYDGKFKVIGEYGDSYDIIRDLDTGCIYAESTSNRGITPLYDEEGKVQGCGQKDLNLKKYENQGE